MGAAARPLTGRLVRSWSRPRGQILDQKPNPTVTIGAVRFGNALPLALIAGPCGLGKPGARGWKWRPRSRKSPDASASPRLQDLVRQGQPHVG